MNKQNYNFPHYPQYAPQLAPQPLGLQITNNNYPVINQNSIFYYNLSKFSNSPLPENNQNLAEQFDQIPQHMIDTTPVQQDNILSNAFYRQAIPQMQDLSKFPKISTQSLFPDQNSQFFENQYMYQNQLNQLNNSTQIPPQILFDIERQMHMNNANYQLLLSNQIYNQNNQLNQLELNQEKQNQNLSEQFDQIPQHMIDTIPVQAVPQKQAISTQSLFPDKNSQFFQNQYMYQNQWNANSQTPQIPSSFHQNQWNNSTQIPHIPMIKMEPLPSYLHKQSLFNPQYPNMFTGNQIAPIPQQQEQILFDIEKQMHINYANYQLLLRNYIDLKIYNQNNQNNQVEHKQERKIFKRKIKENFFDNSKNILREYQRAIYKYILNNQQLCEKMLGFPLEDIVKQRRQLMGNIQSIKDLRSLWIKPDDSNKEEVVINTMIRKISYKFLREEAIAYFSKRKNKIENILAYKSLLMKFLSEPNNFIALKISKKQ